MLYIHSTKKLPPQQFSCTNKALKPCWFARKERLFFSQFVSELVVLYIKVVEFCKLLARLFCKIRFALIVVIHCISG